MIMKIVRKNGAGMDISDYRVCSGKYSNDLGMLHCPTLSQSTTELLTVILSGLSTRIFLRASEIFLWVRIEKYFQ